MAKKTQNTITDLDECRRKIRGILEEYNCRLLSADEYSHVLLYDKDTQETTGNLNPEWR